MCLIKGWVRLLNLNFEINDCKPLSYHDKKNSVFIP